MSRVLVLHPGEMGSAVGAALAAAGHAVTWVAAGRSAATAGRAERAGLGRRESLTEAVAESELVLSICPPDRSLEVAKSVATAMRETRRAPAFVDANAIAPITMSFVAAEFDDAGCPVIDGGIVGPPPTTAGLTRLFVSGPDASSVTTLFAGTHVECIDLDADVGAASALKMTYAGWTKGTAALLLTIAAAADAYGVLDALRDEWDRSQPGLAARLEGTSTRTPAKAWRWEGEMEEIAATLAQQRLPAGFHLGAAEVWRRLSEFKDTDAPGPDDTIARLLDPG